MCIEVTTVDSLFLAVCKIATSWDSRSVIGNLRDRSGDKLQVFSPFVSRRVQRATN